MPRILNVPGMRARKSDGFDAMISADHAGAREDKKLAVAAIIARCAIAHASPDEIAAEVLDYLYEGDAIE